MKILILVALAATTSPVIAQPYHHAHRHLSHAVAKREPEPVEAAVYVPGPVETVVVYELNGHPIPEEEVRQGIANGTLVWGDDGSLSTSVVALPTPAPTPPPEPVPEHQPEPTAAGSVAGESSAVAVAPSSNVQPTSEPSATPTASPAPSASPTPSQPSGQSGGCSDCDKEFPNGQFSCDEFPAGYGAIPLEHEGLGGWTGIQDPVYRGADGLDDIMTVPHGSCNDGSCCTPGRFCSYGCPNPYLKLSLPKVQGRTKQSVGGLYCNEDGKLEMGDGSLGKTLCGKGSDKMTVEVQNKLSQNVSICRTDYPGTESMTIPLTISPGETAELANPDQGKYFFWDGKATSAQYYINNKGVPEDQACTWGDGSKATGNWAPLNFGTSWDDLTMNMGFSALSPNHPTTDARLDFTITFVGDGINNKCKYDASTQQYCQGAGNDYSECDRDKGCTASVKSGSALTLVFTD